jgi:pyruvate dehydrogenase E1 component beta subunit
MTTMSIIEAIRTTLTEELEHDERVMLLGEDIGVSGGVFRATDALSERFGPDRVVDTSIGLATSGLVPVVELQFLGFAHQAFHQIGFQLARFRYRTLGRFPLQLTIRAPYGGSVHAPELHSDAFEGVLAHHPGLKIVAPSTAADAAGLLRAAIRDPDPVLYLEPLKGYRLVRDDVPDGAHTVPIGSARIARPGADVTVIAWSYQVVNALEAAEEAAEDGIDVEVIDLRTLVPIDEDTICDSVARTGRGVVVEEGPLTGGFGGEIVATVQERAFLSLEAPLERVAGWDVPYPMPLLENDYVPGPARILAAIRRTVAF